MQPGTIRDCGSRKCGGIPLCGRQTRRDLRVAFRIEHDDDLEGAGNRQTTRRPTVVGQDFFHGDIEGAGHRPSPTPAAPSIS